jgi:hypothetical protein
MSRRRHSWRARLGILLCAVAASSTLGSGCFSGTIREPGGSCQSTRAYFLSDVWGPVMARTCVNCHAPGGEAQLRNAQFRLLPASYPDFVDANLASATQMANTLYTINGRQIPALLAKPMGLMNHGGMRVFEEGSPEYNALAEFVRRVSGDSAARNDSACRDFGSLAPPSGVAMMDLPTTLRRASLDLLGRLPTQDELTRASTDDAGFEATLATMIEDEAFYRRMRTSFNDMMLTDRYVATDGCDQRALNLVSEQDFPNRGQYGGGSGSGTLDCCGMDRDNPACTDVRDFFLRANNAIAREPVNLFEHVIRNNRPYSEILTADYVLVNPQSAFVYGVQDQVNFAGGYGSSELREARITYTRRDGMQAMPAVPFPHAGVLTTAAFLSRYPTTDTNRNRHRARIVQAYFLATDILKVGERPIDPTAGEAQIMTPTLNYGPCVTCHRINDPIAGAFRGFFPNNQQWRYNPRDPWYSDMFPPGFANDVMPGENYPAALQWLAPRITQDARFATSAVRFAYQALTGREPLVHPTDIADPLYAERSTAWNEQDRIFRAIARRFLAENMNFKVIVLEVIKSPLYRAVAVPSSVEMNMVADARVVRHAGIGSSRLLTPELLAQRIRAIAGFGWARDARGEQDWLLNDYYFLYGGINSDTIVRRTTDSSGVIANIATRMANEVACRGTATDFARPQAMRRFFTRVEDETIPESSGAAVPASVALIRQNIADLHFAILGERVEPDSEEVTRTYTLFLETWREQRGLTGAARMALPGQCQATTDPATGTAIPMASQVTSDPNGTIRAWMAVLTYLFSDYRFLYQ